MRKRRTQQEPVNLSRMNRLDRLMTMNIPTQLAFQASNFYGSKSSIIGTEHDRVQPRSSACRETWILIRIAAVPLPPQHRNVACSCMEPHPAWSNHCGFRLEWQLRLGSPLQHRLLLLARAGTRPPTRCRSISLTSRTLQ